MSVTAIAGIIFLALYGIVLIWMIVTMYRTLAEEARNLEAHLPQDREGDCHHDGRCPARGQSFRSVDEDRPADDSGEEV